MNSAEDEIEMDNSQEEIDGSEDIEDIDNDEFPDEEEEENEEEEGAMKKQLENLIAYFTKFRNDTQNEKESLEQRIRSLKEQLVDKEKEFNNKVVRFKKDLGYFQGEMERLHLLLEAEEKAHSQTLSQLKNQIDGTQKYSGKHTVRIAFNIEMGVVNEVQLVTDEDTDMGKLRTEHEMMMKLMTALKTDKSVLIRDLNEAKKQLSLAQNQNAGNNPTSALEDLIKLICNKYLDSGAFYEVPFDKSITATIFVDSKKEPIPFETIFDSLAEILFSKLQTCFNFWRMTETDDRQIEFSQILESNELLLEFCNFFKSQVRSETKIRKKLSNRTEALTQDDVLTIYYAQELFLLFLDLRRYSSLLSDYQQYQKNSSNETNEETEKQDEETKEVPRKGLHLLRTSEKNLPKVEHVELVRSRRAKSQSKKAHTVRHTSRLGIERCVEYIVRNATTKQLFIEKGRPEKIKIIFEFLTKKTPFEIPLDFNVHDVTSALRQFFALFKPFFPNQLMQEENENKTTYAKRLQEQFKKVVFGDKAYYASVFAYLMKAISDYSKPNEMNMQAISYILAPYYFDLINSSFLNIARRSVISMVEECAFIFPRPANFPEYSPTKLHLDLPQNISINDFCVQNPIVSSRSTLRIPSGSQRGTNSTFSSNSSADPFISQNSVSHPRRKKNHLRNSTSLSGSQMQMVSDSMSASSHASNGKKKSLNIKMAHDSSKIVPSSPQNSPRFEIETPRDFYDSLGFDSLGYYDSALKKIASIAPDSLVYLTSEGLQSKPNMDFEHEDKLMFRNSGNTIDLENGSMKCAISVKTGENETVWIAGTMKNFGVIFVIDKFTMKIIKKIECAFKIHDLKKVDEDILAVGESKFIHVYDTKARVLKSKMEGRGRQFDTITVMDKSVWILSSVESRIFVWKKNSNKSFVFVKKIECDTPVTCCVANKNLWVGTTTGLKKIDIKNYKFDTEFAKKKENNDDVAFVINVGKFVWSFTNKGLMVWDSLSNELAHMNSSLYTTVPKSVICLGKYVWVAHANGVINIIDCRDYHVFDEDILDAHQGTSEVLFSVANKRDIQVWSVGTDHKIAIFNTSYIPHLLVQCQFSTSPLCACCQKLIEKKVPNGMKGHGYLCTCCNFSLHHKCNDNLKNQDNFPLCIAPLSFASPIERSPSDQKTNGQSSLQDSNSPLPTSFSPRPISVSPHSSSPVI